MSIDELRAIPKRKRSYQRSYLTDEEWSEVLRKIEAGVYIIDIYRAWASKRGYTWRGFYSAVTNRRHPGRK